MKAQTIQIKTLFKDKAWIHPKYLNIAKMTGGGLILKYKGKVMTIQPEMIDRKYWQKGDREFKDKFSGEPYYIYGIHFVPDNKLKI